MSRYIDAEKILPYISYLFGGMPFAIMKMAETDSIDIVRCKECKRKDEIANYCYENDRNIKPDDFCSRGERSE